MKFNRFTIFVVFLLASSILSIKFSLLNLSVTGEYMPLQISDVYGDKIGSDTNSTVSSGPDGNPSNEGIGSQCDPEDGSCSAPGDGGDSGGSGTGGGGDQCDPTDPNCSVPVGSGGGGGGDQCDFTDPTCTSGSGDSGGSGTGGGGDQCDPFDASCSGGGGGGGDQCDPFDPNCSGGGGGGEQFIGGPNACFDGIDNDGDGLTDSADDDCGGGGPPTPTVPGEGSPVGDRNGDNSQSGGDTVLVRNSVRQHTILGAAFQTNVLPIQAEAGLPREDICDDGQDNNHNGLIDSEDPSCGAATISSVGFESSASIIPDKSFSNVSKSAVLLQNGITGVSPLTSPENNTSVISISGGSKHDIRTISSFHYGYSPERVTIEKGSKVMWTNQDRNELHGINLIDKISGKIIFTYPVIRSGASAFYYFEEAGQFTYSDPKYPSMTGEITVVG